MNKRTIKIPRMTLIVLWISLSLVAGCASTQQSAGDNGFVIANARVFDGTTMLNGYHVVVRDRLIAELSDSDELPMGLDVIDASGMILMPGMIDTHTHT